MPQFDAGRWPDLLDLSRSAMFKSHVYIELGWGDDGYQSYLPPCHPHCATVIPQLLCSKILSFIFYFTHGGIILSLSLYLCCVDYSRQGLPYPPSGYAEMDNAVPPDRYGNYSSPFSPMCVLLSFKSIKAEKKLKRRGMFVLLVLVGRAR